MSFKSHTEKDELKLTIIDSINNSNTIIFDINNSTENKTILKRGVGRPKKHLTQEEKNIVAHKWNKNNKIAYNELHKNYSKRLTQSIKILTYLVNKNLIVNNEYNTDIENFINNKIISENIINLKN